MYWGVSSTSQAMYAVMLKHILSLKQKHWDDLSDQGRVLLLHAEKVARKDSDG